jgi:hypothetical protein
MWFEGGEVLLRALPKMGLVVLLFGYNRSLRRLELYLDVDRPRDPRGSARVNRPREPQPLHHPNLGRDHSPYAIRV